MLLTKQNSLRDLNTHKYTCYWKIRNAASSQSIFSSVISRYLALPLFGNKEKQIDNRKYVTSLPRFKNPSRKILPLRKEKRYDFRAGLVLSQFIVCRNLQTRAQINWLIGNNNWIVIVWRTFRQSKRTIKFTGIHFFFQNSLISSLRMKTKPHENSAEN